MKRTTALTSCFVAATFGAVLLLSSYWRHTLPGVPESPNAMCEKCLEGAQQQWDCGGQVGGGCAPKPKWEDQEFCEGARAAETEKCLKLCTEYRGGSQ